MAKNGDPMTDDRPSSKTQKKQEMHALQATGERLVRLPEERLRKFNLPDDLLTALLEAKRISAHGGLRRQLRYIGKLMRGVDMDRLAQDLDAINVTSAQQDRLLHAAEQWRERLLTEASALDEFLRTYPEVDAQPLRTLLRNIKNEPADRPSKYRRSLFRMLHALLASRSQDTSSP
jgi:ribosome-associated protein